MNRRLLVKLSHTEELYIIEFLSCYLLPGLFITSIFQEGSRHVAVVDEEFIPLKENRVQSAVEDFTECPVLGMEQEIAEGKTSQKMEQDITSSKNGEKAIETKKDSEELKSFKEQFESQLERERVRIRYLEEKVDNYEIERRDGIEMYKELAAKCNQLREELNEQRSSRKEAEKTLQDKIGRASCRERV